MTTAPRDGTTELPEGMTLQQIQVRGLGSLRSAVLELSSPVTVLVGANGAGKSQLLEAFELLGRIVDRQLDHYVDRASGRSTQLAGPELEIWLDHAAGSAVGYRVSIDLGRNVVDEVLLHTNGRELRPREIALGQARESQLRLAVSDSGAVEVLQVLSGCRVHHFGDTSSDAPPMRRVDPADNTTLAYDARNVAAVLLRLRSEDPAQYRRVVRTVRTIAPHFDDFVLEVESTAVQLRWLEQGRTSASSADELGGGTLRFICLAVLLLQSEPPGTIVIDEPELGLHPFAVHQLAALLKRAARRRRVIVATQSVTLLEQFGVDEVAIVERTSAGTQVRRPDRVLLEQWLSEYTLGDLWEKNLLGGRPQPDSHPSDSAADDIPKSN